MTAPLTSQNAADALRHLPLQFDRCENFGKTLAAWRAGRETSFDGVWGSGCAPLLARALNESNGTLLAIFAGDRECLDFSRDWPLFSRERLIPFPAYERALEEISLGDDMHGERLKALRALAEGNHAPRAIVVASIKSLMQPSCSREELAASAFELRTGSRLEIESFLRRLVERGFENVSAVQMPGEFSVRGGILDFFPPDVDQPYRIELFDDEIESLRRFDLVSQRSLEKFETLSCTIPPPPGAMRGSLPEYLPAGTWIALIEPQRIHEEARNYLRHVERPQWLREPAELLLALREYPLASIAGLAAASSDTACAVGLESVERFTGELGKVREELDAIAGETEVIVTASTEAETERLQELLGTTHAAVSGKLRYVVGELTAGFAFRQAGVSVITAHELFHRGELRRTPRKRLGKAIDSFFDLREGDLVVHLAHGIGRYRGLKRIEKGAHVEEHLEIEFHGGTKIYVPGVKIGLVQKYIGGTKSSPTLAKIGGKSWLKQKAAAEDAVADLAAEMLELQAVRTARPGISFGPDSAWQHEFDASFPYEETPDQLSAIESIKADMQRKRPMDRLLCGDVGFGKTEVAMRAVFKAIDAGHQAAVLVPTTILAEQHYRTFVERMIEFPFNIAKLSRFCSSQEEREAIEGLKSGKVDVVIGTHRLASQDVEFHNLGLVVIDEEQRFGVDVKERLKTFRATVDVLTMSATPIPRTLHMSLVGVRDISNLETAPLDRTAVETKVLRWNDEQIRHAVLRELGRGGQIYFVHNRVQDIELVQAKLQRIVPEAKIRYGHGQMNETELERVMLDFIDHKFDLLLATTIIESGLDIPNANTIFIDEADRYGLADLHQLRGRVGRYKHHAYCYLLLEPDKYLTPNASRRLRAIEEFSEMGAGFAISMRDLEIRGAGNLLGTQQSGHIAAVGYELYCQLLETAVRHLQKKPPRIELDVDLDLPLRAYLPDDYVIDMRQKIDLYRRLSRIERFDQIEDLRKELQDRFGTPPQEVERLFELASLKMDAAVWQVVGVFCEPKFLVLRFANAARIAQLAKLHKGRLRVVDETSAYWPLAGGESPETLLATAKQVLRPI